MKKSPGIFFYFLLAWGIINLIQAFFTPLHNDEAYYWMYSKYLAWGYYDHPPMIAAFIKAGYAIFAGKLGVRLLTVISLIIVFYIVRELFDKEKKGDEKSILTLVLIISVLPVFNLYGLFAVPDSPLLLFTALFLLFYKRFLVERSWQNTFALGFIMAGLMYSKYHGAILILLIIISNLHLLKTPKFYIAALTGLILFLPHIYWQYVNDFPSLKYHLIERASGFNLKNVPEYILNQFVFYNPFILPVFLLIIFRTKVRDTFERGLKFVIAGFFIFFFASSFRYNVQPQWTAIISIPMVILFFNHADFGSGMVRYARKAAMVMLPLFLFARSTLIIDYMPVPFLKKTFHETRPRMMELGRLAGSRPVVFTNSYQEPSQYTFNTGQFAHSLNNKDYRKTQYDLWPFEEQVHGKEVLYIPHWLNDYLKSILSLYITSDGDSVYYRIFKDFQSLQRECVICRSDTLSFRKNADNSLDFRIYNPYPYPIKLNHPEFPVVFQAGFYTDDWYLETKQNLELPAGLTVIEPGDTVNVKGKFRIDELPEGEYNFVILSETGILFDTFSSKMGKAKIRP